MKAMIVGSSLSVAIYFLFVIYYIHKNIIVMLFTWYTNSIFSIFVLIKVILKYNELNTCKSILDKR